MLEVLKNLVTSGSFIPHGHCYLWMPGLVLLHVASDCLTAIAYYSIPMTLIYFVRKRRDVPYRWMFLLFGAFIIACGTTHIMEIWTLWHPTYWLSGYIKAITAFVSLYTAVLLVPLVPKALTLPSPGQLEFANRELEREITERKQVEAALRLKEERYLAILEDQTELIARFQADGTLTFVNEAYCRYFGKQREELIANSYEPVIFEEDRAHVAQLLGTLNSENPVVTIENRVVVHGQVRWTQWSNRMIFDEQNRCVEFQSVGQDITERKQALESLRESESILRSFYNSAPMMMGVVEVTDDDILHLSDNAAAARFFGLTPEAMRHRKASEMGVPKEQLYQWIRHYRESESTGNPIRFEYVDNTTTVSKCLAATVSLIQKTPSGWSRFSYVVEDVTERQQALENIKSLQEKEVLLKEIHHRVKNNLQIICSLLNLQSRSIKEQPILDIFNESQNRVRAMALIHEKLYQAKDLSKINFAEYIHDLAKNLFRAYQVKSSAVTLKLNLSNVFLNVDAAVPCGLIINELVTNSLKHAFPSGQTGEVCINIHKDTDNQVKLSVTDNGNGFPRELEFNKTQTIGLQLVCTLTKQLRAEMKLKRMIKGTEFKFTFASENF